MTDFNDQLNDALKYGRIDRKELQSLATMAKKGDSEEIEAGRNEGPNTAAGILADLLADKEDPREMIVRRSQERRQKAMELGVHPVTLNGDYIEHHLGIDGNDAERNWDNVHTEAQEDHHYPDTSVLHVHTYTHTPTGRNVHWATWEVPTNTPDSEPFVQTHSFAGPVTDEELQQLKSE